MPTNKNAQLRYQVLDRYLLEKQEYHIIIINIVV